MSGLGSLMLLLYYVCPRVWFPAPTKKLIITYNSSSRGPGTPPALCRLPHMSGANKLTKIILIHLNKN